MHTELSSFSHFSHGFLAPVMTAPLCLIIAGTFFQLGLTACVRPPGALLLGAV